MSAIETNHPTNADPRLIALRFQHIYSGKVRDLYTHERAPGRVLVVASDRVSAFDHILEPGIPGKGALLTQLSLWWFGKLGMPHHLAAGHPSLGNHLPADIAERSMLVHELDMFPLECVVRGYLVGSGWAEYQQTQAVCGVALPAGLSLGDRLPEPIYTPATKAPIGEHDENITFEQTVELVGAENAEALREASLRAFTTASALAETKGVILADTKFEFGSDPETGELLLADEVLTSDSSRYWDSATYAAGGTDRLESFDKQIVRNWLADNWDKTGTPPALPDEIVARTSERYRELIRATHGVSRVNVELRAVSWDDPAGEQLRTAQRVELTDRYGDPDSEPGPLPTADDMTVYYVAFDETGQALGCGGLRALDAEHGEIKRMYVDPAARGTGVSVAIIRRLEEDARAFGWKRLVLETGERQPDAMRFYEREGYHSIPRYGYYVDSELSRCYEKSLAE